MKTKNTPALVGAFTNETLPLAHIATSKNIPLRNLNDAHVTGLVTSILKAGLDNPLDVWGGEASGAKMQLKGGEKIDAAFLIAGNHRREALRRIHAEHPDKFAALFPAGVPVRRRVGPLADALLLQLRENVQREDMEADQIFPVLTHLVQLGLKQNVIANRVGKSTAWVSTMLEVNRELGDEGAEEVAKGGLPVRAAVKAAKEVKAAKKAGQAVDTKAALKKAKDEHDEAKAGNAKRAKKRVGLKELYSRYGLLPVSKATIGRKVQILEGIIAYAIGESNKLPDEVKSAPIPAKK